ncbi:MAG TPA: LysR family transcriptional regulator [Patescibacteria group bacterium]
MIEELQRFILVAQNGNLTKTAASLFITQSALSQSIKRLEKELNTKLFIPKGKALQITPDGLMVMEMGQRIIELWKKLKAPSTNLTKPTLTLGVFDNAALKLGTYFQKSLQGENFNLELVIDTSGKLLSKLQYGIVDIAIAILDKNMYPDKNLILLKTFSEKLIPVAKQKFKADLKTIPFILYNKDSHTRKQLDDVFMKNGLQPNIYAESTSVTFMKELAILGSGVALLPENLITNDLQQGVLQEQKLPITFRRQYGIYITRHGRLTKDHLLIKNLLGELAQ